MHFLATSAFLLTGAHALLGDVPSGLNVPPFVPAGQPSLLHGNALHPLYNDPIEVEIWNPAVDIPARIARINEYRAKRETALQANQPSTAMAQAVYTLTNDTSNYGNLLLAYLVNQTDGSLYNHYTYANNGNGAKIADKISKPTDFLDSQGPVRQSGSRLFAVNTGSNTFQAYAINCSNPAQLTFLGGPVKVYGDYPTTLDVASENQIVCVGTTGQVAGISCYTYNVGFGAADPPTYFSGTQVTLQLPDPQGAGAPVGPADTISQLLFTDDEKYVIAIVKGAASYNNGGAKSGYIAVFPIGSNGFGTPVYTTPTGTEYLQGCTLQYGTYKFLCADLGPAFFYMEMDSKTLKIDVLRNTTVNDDGLAGWTVRSRYNNGPMYGSLEGAPVIGAWNQSTGELVGAFESNTGVPQFSSLTTANNWVYALTFGNASITSYLNVFQDTNLAGDLQQQYLYELPCYTCPDAADNGYYGLDVFVLDDPSNTCDFD